MDKLEANRAILVALLRPGDRHYINNHWRAREKDMVYYYIKLYLNLGSTASQRGESYYPVVREITSSQLSFKDSGKALSKKILSIYKDLILINTHQFRAIADSGSFTGIYFFTCGVRLVTSD